MTNNQQQHYVPKVLLAHYARTARSNRLFVFDKHTSKTFPGAMSVEKICKEGGFYDVDSTQGKISLEQAFHQMERSFGDIAAKVAVSKSIHCLTKEEFGTLISFVCAQFIRVPRMRTAFQQATTGMIEKMKAIAPTASNLDEIEKTLNGNQLKLRHLEGITTTVSNGVSILSRYAWFLIETQDVQHRIWISDCPVTLHNDEDLGPYGGLGLAAPGIQIYMPISPTLMLACWHPAVVGRFVEEQSTGSATLNKLKFQYLLGTSKNKAELKRLIFELEAKLKPIQATITAIRNGSSVKASAEHVVFYNWLQFQWSYRFILSSECDFTLAMKMLREHPDLRTGIHMSVS